MQKLLWRLKLEVDFGDDDRDRSGSDRREAWADLETLVLSRRRGKMAHRGHPDRSDRKRQSLTSVTDAAGTVDWPVQQRIEAGGHDARSWCVRAKEMFASIDRMMHFEIDPHGS
jgi:hypothetical protein